MKSQELYIILKNELPQSTAHDRQAWAKQIVEEEIDLKNFSDLLFCEPQITSRFMWLLTDVGEADSTTLLKFLPYLLNVREEINYKEIGASLANYWLVSGVPLENETQAIDLLFLWVHSINSNVTTKSRSIFVLYNLTKKYPELKNELKVTLQGQLIGNNSSFERRVRKILNKLEE